MDLNHICHGCFSEKYADTCAVCGFNPAAESRPAFALPLGAVLNERYVVGKLLRQSPFFEYVGFDQNLNKKVFISEGAVPPITQLDGAISVIDQLDYNGKSIMIADFIDGGTLGDFLKANGKLSLEKANKLLQPAMTALAALHERGLTHLNISPESIFVPYDMTRSYLDIRTIGAEANNDFASAEKLSGGDVSAASDVYSMAAVVYLTLTGVMPQNAAARAQGDTLLPPSRAAQGISADIDQVMMMGLNVSADSRFKNISAFANALNGKASAPAPQQQTPPTPAAAPIPPQQQYAAQPGTYASPVSSSLQQPKKLTKTPAFWIILVVALALVAGVTILVVKLLGDKDDPVPVISPSPSIVAAPPEAPTPSPSVDVTEPAVPDELVLSTHAGMGISFELSDQFEVEEGEDYLCYYYGDYGLIDVEFVYYIARTPIYNLDSVRNNLPSLMDYMFTWYDFSSTGDYSQTFVSAENTTIGGRAAYEVFYDVVIDGYSYNSRTLFLESDNGFGCYLVYSMYETGLSESAQCEAAMNQALDSFKIIGTMTTDVELFSNDNMGMRFFYYTDTALGGVDYYPETETSIDYATVWIFPSDEDTFTSIDIECARSYASSIDEVFETYDYLISENFDDEFYYYEPYETTYGSYTFTIKEYTYTSEGYDLETWCIATMVDGVPYVVTAFFYAGYDEEVLDQTSAILNTLDIFG